MAVAADSGNQYCEHGTCIAHDGAVLCNCPLEDNLLWCPRHCKLQQKAYKCYKIASSKLEACEDFRRVNSVLISQCETMETLLDWDDNLRMQYNLFSRAMENRRKHHDKFYSGGDEGHNRWIMSLEERRAVLEELLLQVEDRAYTLLIKEEDGQWLSELTGTVCEGDDHAPEEDPCVSHHEDPTLDQPSSPKKPDKVKATLEPTSLSMLALMKLPHRERLLLYYDYAKSFEDPEEEDFARRILDNIFRYVLSRHQKLLFHAKRSTAGSVWDFISDADYLHDTQTRQLWEGMKMRGWHGIGKEGKITTEVIMYAIQDAESPKDAVRDGPSIEFLGGKVWMKPLKTDISQRGWAHFYQFVACADCASAHAQTFVDFQRMKRLAKPGYVFEGWTGKQVNENERAVLDRGGIVHHASPSKGVTLETVRPTRKGLKNVFIERETRNWVFMRFPVDNPNIRRLTHTDRSDLMVYSRVGKSSEVETNMPTEKFWLKRVRSGNTTLQRKAARWTIDDNHCEPPCWFNELNNGGCPCPRHERAQKYVKQSIDVMVFDLAEKQTFSTLMEKIFDVLGGDEALIDDSAYSLQKNKAYFSGIGRKFFHESAW